MSLATGVRKAIMEGVRAHKAKHPRGHVDAELPWDEARDIAKRLDESQTRARERRKQLGLEKGPGR